jgi:hypothetical protein
MTTSARKPLPFSVKFTRDERFTPASLTPAELGTLEAFAVAYCETHYSPNARVIKHTECPLVDTFRFDMPHVVAYWDGDFSEAQRMVSYADGTDAARRYLKACVNFIIACAKNKGYLTIVNADGSETHGVRPEWRNR